MSIIKKEPVAFFGLLQAALTAVVTLLVAFNAWHPTDDQIAAVLGVYTAATVIATFLIRGGVSPTAD